MEPSKTYHSGLAMLLGSHGETQMVRWVDGVAEGPPADAILLQGCRGSPRGL